MLMIRSLESTSNFFCSSPVTFTCPAMPWLCSVKPQHTNIIKKQTLRFRCQNTEWWHFIIPINNTAMRITYSEIEMNSLKCNGSYYFIIIRIIIIILFYSLQRQGHHKLLKRIYGSTFNFQSCSTCHNNHVLFCLVIHVFPFAVCLSSPSLFVAMVSDWVSHLFLISLIIFPVYVNPQFLLVLCLASSE